MKKKLMITLLLTMLFSVLLFAVSEAGCIFLTIPVGSLNYAMGSENSTADIWHNNAFSTQANPALASFHEGITFSNSHDNWFDKVEGISDMYFSSRYINVAYKGIGINLPLPNQNAYTGTSLDYGMQERLNANGQIVDIFHSYEYCKNYTLAVNSSSLDLMPYDILTVGAGLTYSKIYSHLSPEGVPANQNVKGNSSQNVLNLGLIGKIDVSKLIQDNPYTIQATLGYSAMNIGRKKMNNIDEDDPLPNENKLGLGLYASYPLSDSYDNPLLNFIAKNLYSGMLLINNTSSENLSSTSSFGMEVGLLDTFFLRTGYHSDPKGQIKGETLGYGIKLNFSKYAFVEYNYSQFPGGELQHTQNNWDISTGIDFTSFLK